MLAEILSIGDELLIGQTLNTNAAWVGEQLSLIGIKVHQVSTIADEEQHIMAALNEAKERVQVVIITGGLGPTKDDLTKHTLCKYFTTELVLHQDILEKLEGLYQKYNVSFTQINQEQAWLPKNCTILPNTKGTASGMWFEKDDVIFISLPGVPHEMKDILSKEVFPKLKNQFELPKVIHKTIRTIGQPESKLAQLLENWEDSLSDYDLKLAYLPSPGAVRLRVSGEQESGSGLEEIVQKKIDELSALIGDCIYGVDKESIEEVVGNLLTVSGKTLCTAESCTGGSISGLLTSVSGSSVYFKGSIVSYANEIKINVLNVSADSIEKHGVVSEQVVEQMARNARAILDTDYAIATSGVAGPTGGSEKKPVGMVWLAVASKDEMRTKKLSLPYNNRERNILVSANYALDFLRTEFL